MTRGLAVAIGVGAVVVWMVFLWNEETESVDLAAAHGEGPVVRTEDEASVRPEAVGTIELLEQRLRDREAQVEELQRRLADLENPARVLEEKDSEIRRLREKLAALPAPPPAGEEPESEEESPPRSKEEILSDFRELARKGVAAYAQLQAKNHPLVEEFRRLDGEGIDLLSGLLSEGGDSDRFLAAAMMEALKDPRAIGPLESAIFDGNAENVMVQRMSSHALAFLDSEEEIPALERVMKEGSEWGVRINATYGLAKRGHRGAVQQLRQTYRDADDAISREQTFAVMAEVGEASYLPLFQERLGKEETYSTRFVAVRGIAKVGDEASLPLLSAIAEDPGEDKALQVEAKKAYNKIIGEEFYPVD